MVKSIMIRFEAALSIIMWHFIEGKVKRSILNEHV